MVQKRGGAHGARKGPGKRKGSHGEKNEERDPSVRAENEDDDGYDPYSDRLPRPEPLFERDPWK